MMSGSARVREPSATRTSHTKVAMCSQRLMRMRIYHTNNGRVSCRVPCVGCTVVCCFWFRAHVHSALKHKVMMVCCGLGRVKDKLAKCVFIRATMLLCACDPNEHAEISTPPQKTIHNYILKQFYLEYLSKMKKEKKTISRPTKQSADATLTLMRSVHFSVGFCV